jgi:hypothetical protein
VRAVQRRDVMRVASLRVREQQKTNR